VNTLNNFPTNKIEKKYKKKLQTEQQRAHVLILDKIERLKGEV
jgi:hypothetical protein